MVEKYRKGTKTEHFATQVKSTKFYHYWHKPWIKQSTTSKRYFHKLYGISTPLYVLTSAQDAMTFNNFHEGIHLGVILGLRKLV
jgi:hypothetical protein